MNWKNINEEIPAMESICLLRNPHSTTEINKYVVARYAGESRRNHFWFDIRGCIYQQKVDSNVYNYIYNITYWLPSDELDTLSINIPKHITRLKND